MTKQTGRARFTPSAKRTWRPNGYGSSRRSSIRPVRPSSPKPCETVQGWRLTWDAAPGFTTRLLSRIARPERTVGVDRSKAFLSQARAGAAAGEEYVTADVAVAPLRIAGIGAQPDLIYARFLSSHLPEPEQAVAGWAKELAAGGLLLLALLADSHPSHFATSSLRPPAATGRVR